LLAYTTPIKLSLLLPMHERPLSGHSTRWRLHWVDNPQLLTLAVICLPAFLSSTESSCCIATNRTHVYPP
jgi:hypothetical protein